jgi:LysM repeat protein
MSEAAPETSGGGGGGVLTRKVGPLAVWAWLAIVTVLGAGYYLYAKAKSGGSGTAASTSGTGSETPAGDVPDYVSQTTINLPQPVSTGTTPPPGAPPATPAPPKTPAPVKKAPAPAPKKTTTAPKKSTQPPVFSNSYTVKAGDTLDSLAAKFGITRVELAHANGLGTGAGLKTGQVLKVPGPVTPISKGGKG